MSTRANVVIKKTTENGKVSYAQLYHHHDGYCSGVGKHLSEYMGEIGVMPDEEFKKVMKNPVSLAKWLSHSDRDDEYEYEGTNVNLHGDIEYLYVIDLTNKTITCYSICNWGNGIDDLAKVNGEVKQCEDYFICYSVSMWRKFSNFKHNIREEWDGDVTFDGKIYGGSNEEYVTMDIKTLLSIVEKVDIHTVLKVLESSMTKYDLHKVLVKMALIAEKM